jgi:hypothetical protein
MNSWDTSGDLRQRFNNFSVVSYQLYHDSMGHCIEGIYTKNCCLGDKSGPGADVAVAKVATVSEHAFEAPRKGSDLNPVTGEMSSSLSIDLPFSILSPLPILPPSSPSDVPLPPGPKGYQPNQPASSSERELCIDGYIAQMFGPQVAQEYHVSLLKRESGQIQVQADVAGTDAFLATPPPGTRSGQHGWVIDYAVIERGPVIPQKIWAPKKFSDMLRWVDHEQLHPPIFFIHENGQDLGLPLKDAAGGNCMCLRGAASSVRN